tara:strand:- start:4575 stop:4784 length:210 start_codon:yes stop_codon:yes gene_type:complete
MGGYSLLKEMVTLHVRVSILSLKTVKRGAIVFISSVVIRNFPKWIQFMVIQLKKSLYKLIFIRNGLSKN